MLFTVWASGLMRLSVESFPQNVLRWGGRRLMVMSAAALWFLARAIRRPDVGCRLHRHDRHRAAAGMVGRRLSAPRPTGAIGRRAGDRRRPDAHFRESSSRQLVSLVVDLGATEGQLSGVTVITTLFVALGMFILVFEDMTDELSAHESAARGCERGGQATGDHRSRRPAVTTGASSTRSSAASWSGIVATGRRCRSCSST